MTAVFLSPISHPRLFVIYFLALPLFGILRSIAGVPLFPTKNILVPLLGLLSAILISAFATPDLQFSLRKISGLVNSIGLFIALLTSAPKQWNIPNWLLLFFGLLISGVGAIGSDIDARIPLLFPFFKLFYLIVPYLPNVQRIINANLVAGALLWTLPFTVGMCVYYWQKKSNSNWLLAITGIALLIQAYLLILMQSRAALTAVLITGICALGITVPGARKMIRNLIVGVALVMAVLFSPIAPEPIKEGMQSAYFNLLVKGDEGEKGLDSLDGRVKIWSRAIEKVSEKPIFGNGMNNFRKIANYPTPVFDPVKEIPHAHNWALQIILELGLIGLFFYIWLLIVAINNLWEVWQKNTSDHPVVLGYAAALFAFMLFGLLDTISPGARPDFIFWILLAGALNIQSSK